MAIMKEFEGVKSEEEGFEILLRAGALCVSSVRPEFWQDNKQTEAFEDVIDMPTVYKILDICGGIKLNDPNLLAAAAEALGKN